MKVQKERIIDNEIKLFVHFAKRKEGIIKIE